MNPNRASLLVLGAAAMMVSADARVVDPLLKVIATEFGVDIHRAALLVTAYTLPYGICQLFYGTLADRLGKLKVMSVALFFFAVGTAACAAVPAFLPFVGLRFITGVFAAAMIPLSLSYIGDKVEQQDRQVALGRFMSSLMLGQILSAVLGGVFGERIGWRPLFLFLGGAAAVASAMLWNEARRNPEAAGNRPFTLSVFGKLLLRPDARRILGAVCVEGVFVFGTLAFLAATVKERFPGLGHDTIGFGLAFYGVGGIIYSLTVKRLVPVLGERGIVSLGGLCLAGACGLHALLPAWWLFPVAMVLYGMGYVTLHGTLQTHATELDPAARATAVSLFAFVFFLGQATGPVVMGQLLATVGIQNAFLAAATGLVLLTGWIRWRIARPRRASA